MLRMNTPASCACACMRSRSPSTAPPLNGLVGSTAITPTVGNESRPDEASLCEPCGRPVRNAVTSRSTSVLFPAPGGPVTPTRYALPVRPKCRRRTSVLAAFSPSRGEMGGGMARGSPASTRSDRDALRESRAREELPRDHEPLDLARALADGQEFDVAEIFLGRIVLHEA